MKMTAKTLAIAAAAFACSGAAFGQGGVLVYDSGRPHQVSQDSGATFTYLGFSSGAIAVGTNQRWWAAPFTVGSGIPAPTIQAIDIDWFLNNAGVNIRYIISNRVGLTDPDGAAAGLSIVSQGILGPYADGVDDGRVPGAETWFHRYESLAINLAPGDYWFTMYADGDADGDGLSNSPWLTGGELPPAALENNAGAWRSANYPSPGFLAYAPATIVLDPDATDPILSSEDRWNVSFTLWHEVPPPPPPPANDECSAAVPLDLNAFPVGTGTTLGATSDTQRSCDPTAGAVGTGVWYTFTGTGSDMTFYLCGGAQAAFDARLSILTGTCANMYCVGFDDDTCGSLMPSLTVCTTNGTNYYLHVAQTSNVQSGGFDIFYTPGSPCSAPAAPANDLACNAQSVAIPSSTAGDIAGATLDAGAPNCAGGAAGDVEAGGVWYKVTGNGTTLTASLCTAATTDPHFDSKMSVYTGNCNNLAGLTCVGGDDDFCAGGSYSRVQWCSTNGQEYLILVHQFFGTTQQPNNISTFTLNVSSDGAQCGCTVGDCNNNGVCDTTDIANGLEADCFNPNGAANTMGGPDGRPDSCQCPANWNHDAEVNSNDVSDYLNTWFADQGAATTNADLLCDGETNSNDVAEFLNRWFAAIAGLNSACPTP